jgi:hypothetical protein
MHKDAAAGSWSLKSKQPGLSSSKGSGWDELLPAQDYIKARENFGDPWSPGFA